MPKQLPDVLELEKLANDLEASIPSLPAEDPSAYPKPIQTAASGSQSQWHRCPEHGPFLRMKLPGVQEWLGQCKPCEDERALEQKARAIMATRQDELRSRVARLMEGCADEIALRVEDQIARYAAELRPEFERSIAASYAEQAYAEAECAFVQDITAELLAKGE